MRPIFAGPVMVRVTHIASVIRRRSPFRQSSTKPSTPSMITSILYILKPAALAVYHVMPHSQIFKILLYVIYLLEFLADHKRLPIHPTLLFNDFLFQLKSGPEITRPLRKLITDKEFAKNYIETKVGIGTTPTTLCILRTPDEVEAYRPPIFPVVIKPTHSWGRIVIAFSESDYQRARTTMTDWLSHDYFLEKLERNYQELDKKIIVETYIDDIFDIEGSVHCMSGEPRIISLIDRKTKHRQSFDVDKAPLGVSLSFPLREFNPKSWGFLNMLMESSRILSSDFSYIRVDFYTDGERVIFGELTNLPAAGRGKFFPLGGEKKFSEVFFKSVQK